MAYFNEDNVTEQMCIEIAKEVGYQRKRAVTWWRLLSVYSIAVMSTGPMPIHEVVVTADKLRGNLHPSERAYEAMAQAAIHKLVRYTPRYDHEELY